MVKKYKLRKGERVYETDLAGEKVNLLAAGWQLDTGKTPVKKAEPVHNKARATTNSK